LFTVLGAKKREAREAPPRVVDLGRPEIRVSRDEGSNEKTLSAEGELGKA